MSESCRYYQITGYVNVPVTDTQPTLAILRMRKCSCSRDSFLDKIPPARLKHFKKAFSHSVLGRERFEIDRFGMSPNRFPSRTRLFIKCKKLF